MMSTSTISRDGTGRRIAAGRDGEVRVAGSFAGGGQRMVRSAGDTRVRQGRAAEWRRPVGAPRHHGGTGVRVSRAAHQPTASPVISNAWMVALFAGVLVVVGGAGFMVRSAGVIDTTTSVAVVQVLPGDTLGDIAARNAPGLAVSQVVSEIRAMNDIAGTQVRAGQSLRVPVTAGR